MAVDDAAVEGMAGEVVDEVVVAVEGAAAAVAVQFGQYDHGMWWYRGSIGGINTNIPVVEGAAPCLSQGFGGEAIAARRLRVAV